MIADILDCLWVLNTRPHHPFHSNGVNFRHYRYKYRMRNISSVQLDIGVGPLDFFSVEYVYPVLWITITDNVLDLS